MLKVRRNSTVEQIVIIDIDIIPIYLTVVLTGSRDEKTCATSEILNLGRT